MIITQVSELLAHIKVEAKKVEFLFRGHATAEWKLMPKIARFEGKDIRNLERLIFKEFKRVSLPFLKKEPSIDFDWLTLAQHFGLPTRFLDWTYNPLAALWFAVNKNGADEKDGAIWRLSPTLKDYQRQQNCKTDNPFIIRKTMLVRPTHISERIVNQMSVFTLHFINKDNKFISLEKDKDFSQKLFKYIIPYSSFRGIREELHRCNVNAASISVDLSGLCRHLEWRYFGR